MKELDYELIEKIGATHYNLRQDYLYQELNGEFLVWQNKWEKSNIDPVYASMTIREIPKNGNKEPKPQPEQYKYEKITGSSGDIAKLVIDDEELYLDKACKVQLIWAGQFLQKYLEEDNQTIPTLVPEYAYRRVKCEWYEKLDSTKENGVLCWVSNNEKIPNNTCVIGLVISFHDDADGDYLYGCSDERWKYATPLTKAEIQKLMDNAPE